MARINSPIPIRKLSATSDKYDRGFHKGNPGGLDAVDTDLAAGNIKDGVTIFGKLGTFTGGPLVQDVVGENATLDLADTSVTGYKRVDSIDAGGDYIIATKTLTFAANSMAVGVAVIAGYTVNDMKLQLVMGGVQVAESAGISTNLTRVCVATRALSGDATTLGRVHNHLGTSQDLERYARGDHHYVCGGVAVGSIKT